MSEEFRVKLPKAPPGMSERQYIEQGFGYPGWAHQDESNELETGHAEPPAPPEPPADLA